MVERDGDFINTGIKCMYIIYTYIISYYVESAEREMSEKWPGKSEDNLKDSSRLHHSVCIERLEYLREEELF